MLRRETNVIFKPELMFYSCRHLGLTNFDYKNLQASQANTIKMT